MSTTLDLIFVAAILLFVIVGVKRGFIRSAVRFLGAVLSAFFASALGGVIAKWVYDALFRDALVEKISATIDSVGGQSLAAGVQELMSSLPDFLVRALEAAGVTASNLQGLLASKTGTASVLVADALSPVFVSFLKVLVVTVLYLLFMMVVRVVADMVGGAFRLPILHQLDMLLGGVFGLLLALVVVWVIAAAIQVFLPMLAEDARAGFETMLDRSILAGTIMRANPMGVMY